MQQLPKIVRERLQATPRSDHPDANVLTAFAEQLLPQSERSLVMEHLARCGDCREVLALALPEMEEAVAPAALRRPWLSLPMLRWGVIAAAFVVVVAVGVVRYRLDSSKDMASALPGPKNEMVSAVNTPLPSATEARQKAVLVKPSPAPAAVQMKTAQKEKETITRSNGVQAQGMNSNASALRRAVPSTRQSQVGLAQSTAGELKAEPKQPPATSIPSQTETVEVASASPVLSTEQSALDSNQGQTQLEIQQSQISPEQQADQELQLETRAVVGKAKAPVAPPAAPSPARNLGGALQMPQVAPVSAPGPRWMITPAGGLQRSYDQGKTWQDIYVAVNQSPASVALQAEGGTRYAQKAAQTKKQKDWVARPVFRVISAAGPEIWAGAAGGVLYHSVDAGDHWTSAVPSDGGILLTGDVTSVQFTDSLHGIISTSTSEMWTTSDGGQGWSKQ